MKNLEINVSLGIVDEDLTGHSDVIPWTIANKYYTAEVHFSVQDLHRIASPMDEGMKAPAIVYVFDRQKVSAMYTVE